MNECLVHVVFFDDAELIYEKTGLAPATAGSVGIDLRVCLSEGETITLEPHQRTMVRTGIGIEPLQPGVAGFVYSRSGLGGVSGITVAQGVGVIDPDYRGEITVPLLNTSQLPYTICRGDRVAQLIFQPYYRPVFHRQETLGATDRGGKGFGHTGRG